MTAPATWEDLKITLEAWAARDDLEERIPEAISLAETWFQREIFSPEREESATLTITNGVAALPTDFAGVKRVYQDGDIIEGIEKVTMDTLRDLYPGSNSGTPRHYAIEKEQIAFGPYPSGTVKLVYIEGITRLSDSQATNWLLTDHPDLYIAASLAELFEFARSYDASDRWRARAVGIAGSVNRAGRRRSINSGPLTARPRNTDQVQAYGL